MEGYFGEPGLAFWAEVERREGWKRRGTFGDDEFSYTRSKDGLAISVVY